MNKKFSIVTSLLGSSFQGKEEGAAYAWLVDDLVTFNQFEQKVQKRFPPQTPHNTLSNNFY